MLGNFAVIYVQALKDEAPFHELTKQWLAELGPLAGAYKIQETPDGYLVTPNDTSLGMSLQLRFAGGYLFVGVGGNALVERSWRAFSAGENTLAAEPAHRAARAALPSTAQICAWLDVGRVVDALQKNPLLAPRVGYLGANRLRFTGPDRVTAALSVSGELRDGSYDYRVDALNLPVFSGLLGVALPQ
jgi:hypothetical protein